MRWRDVQVNDVIHYDGVAMRSESYLVLGRSMANENVTLDVVSLDNAVRYTDFTQPAELAIEGNIVTVERADRR